ncbi:(2Fe-2S) ferredoxin domain-containing protein [Marinilabilia rubra]|uniref:NADP oxidoreductase n=1 Tax=Marinilabilia rubra TaxID=2162893 RepID=A0A2U2BCR6_9BACT|nr:(2Fe-2S) ferredoxin domain-containing protein [Marinilabilia rubra]PWE00866.1 NADP oxidoreductase [Marinilabilia rubra]
MSKVKNLQDLKKMRDDLKGKITLREKSDHPDSLVQIKVSMATCGIASGARDTMNYMVDELESQAVDAVVTQTGCMGYCYAEPTIEVTLPGEKPVVFGQVDTKKASEIIEKYIKNGELVDGIIPDSYETIDKK